MTRTKGDGGAARIIGLGAKAPRKALGGGSSRAASRATSAASSVREGGSGGGGVGYNSMGQPVHGWQKPMTSFFQVDPNAPTLKRKESDKETDEEHKLDTGKVEEDEENESPLKKEKESPKDVTEAKKNGIIDDSDDE